MHYRNSCTGTQSLLCDLPSLCFPSRSCSHGKAMGFWFGKYGRFPVVIVRERWGAALPFRMGSWEPNAIWPVRQEPHQPGSVTTSEVWRPEDGCQVQRKDQSTRQSHSDILGGPSLAGPWELETNPAAASLEQGLLAPGWGGEGEREGLT